ncbi:MAG: hypothetical protein JWO53_1169 [Chlamydiia bacterium]|nr:hypothetical protein [Chlamydiia bacterium]
MDYQEAKESLLHSLLTQSYEIESNGELAQPEHAHDFTLIDEEDRDILMHRDAHFGGKFDLMLHEYEYEKKGAVLDSSLKRIKALQAYEAELGTNIAPILLQGADAEKVSHAKKMYQELSELFDEKAEGISQAIAALILSEDEEAEEEIEKVLSYKQKAIHPLIDILKSDLFKDPLFPGYGKAPLHAAVALGKLKAEEAIHPLFDLLSEKDFELEEAAICTLHAIGQKAKEFLMKTLAAKPITDVNCRAALALLAFKDEPEVPTFFFTKLKEFLHFPALAVYLTLGCEDLPKELQSEFKALAKTPNLSKDVHNELLLISNYWDKKQTFD